MELPSVENTTFRAAAAGKDGQLVFVGALEKWAGKKGPCFFKEELWMVFFYGFFGMEHNGTMLICMDYSLHSLLFIGLSNVIGAFLNVLQ